MLARLLAGATLAGTIWGAPLAGQAPDSTRSPFTTSHLGGAPDSVSASLDSLVAEALAVSPALHTAAARVRAARARIAPAGARPDPMLMAGVQNLPVSQPGFSDGMTMKMIGVSQSIPYPGKLALRSAAMLREADAADASFAAARFDVAHRVRDAYFDLAYIDRALAIAARNQTVLDDLTRVTQAHYSVGTGSQADVLRSQLEVSRLAQEASALAEDRRAALARLDALLDRPSETPIGVTRFPERLRRLAASPSGAAMQFTSASLGARVASSPLLALDSLQTIAERSNPMLRGHEAMIAAQRERVALARKAHLPDVDVSVQYGQRAGLPDMLTAVVSVPLPLQRGRKQDEELAAAVAELNVLEAEHHEQVNALRVEIAGRYSDAERARTQLALITIAVLPQARAALESATASYQVGRASFPAVIDAQAAMFNLETAYSRSLADFGKALAALEQLAGGEVVR